MRNSFLISIIWILPFLISDFFFNQNNQVYVLNGLIRTLLSITFPMICIGAIWGTFEEGQLLKFLRSSIDNKRLHFRITYFMMKMYEGAIAGLVFQIASEAILVFLMTKSSNIFSVFNSIQIDTGPILIGCVIGLLSGFFIRKKFLKLYEIVDPNDNTTMKVA